MDSLLKPSAWYAIVVAGLVVFLVTCFSVRLALRWLASRTTDAILKYVVYTTINPLKLPHWRLSVKDVLFPGLYVSANGICMGWDIKSASDVSNRCASLLVTNLILLLPGASIASDILHISLRTYDQIHSIIGLVALIQGSIHAGLELTAHDWTGNVTSISGTVMFGCLGMMSLASLPTFRHRLYEVFRAIHFGCSTSICIFLWLHASMVSGTARFQAILGASVWVATYTHRNILIIYRNFAVSKPNTSILIENIHNSLRVEVSLPRPWKLRPGQYVYLTMMRPGLFSIFQRHPFMIANSESDGHNFQLRIQPMAGFTNRLLRRSLNGRTRLSALVEGPYGHTFNLREFGTVVLFASGIGIVGHLAYIQELIEDYWQSKTKTRDLLLVWRVDDRYQLDLVWEVMNDILRRDDLPAVELRQGTHRPYAAGKTTRHMGGSSINENPGLRPAPHGENADVYIYGDYKILDETGQAVSQNRAGSRIVEIEGKPDVRQIALDVLRTGVGRVAICVCANRETRYEAQEVVAHTSQKNVRYLELDFQPFEPRRYVTRRRSLQIQCRGV